MSDLIVSLRLAWYVVVRNWVVYRKDFLANISPTLADPALMMTALGMGLSHLCAYPGPMVSGTDSQEIDQLT